MAASSNAPPSHNTDIPAPLTPPFSRNANSPFLQKCLSIPIDTFVGKILVPSRVIYAETSRRQRERSPRRSNSAIGKLSRSYRLRPSCPSGPGLAGKVKWSRSEGLGPAGTRRARSGSHRRGHLCRRRVRPIGRGGGPVAGVGSREARPEL